MNIPPTHPRYRSLRTREELVKGVRAGIVATQGLIAHGRGEAFDYLLGEQTNKPAKKAITVAAALLLTARKPVISVNGNTVALVPQDLIRLAKEIGGEIEVNLFHRSWDRELRIKNRLEKFGANRVMGVGKAATGRIPGLHSLRGRVDPDGIVLADVVFVPLEDGDRAEMLRRIGKKVIAVDLNPLSRTSRSAEVTIVDNVTRALPLLIKEVRRLKKTHSRKKLERLVAGFDNRKNLHASLKEMTQYLSRWNGGE